MNGEEVLDLEKWYTLSYQEVLKKLGSSEKGLSYEEASKRLEKYGFNEIETGRRKTALTIFLNQFKSILVALLIFSTIISFYLGEIHDAIVILAIIVMNSILGFIQEYRAEKSLEALKKLAAPKCKVIRNGVEKVIPARELVPGDIVIVNAGDKIPADIRLIKSINLKVNEAILTGESVPVEKNVEPIKTKGLNVGDIKNMLFTATTATYGRGMGVVVLTGMNTVFGRIARLIQEAEEETPLQRRLGKLGRWLTLIIIILTVFVFIEGILEGANYVEIFLTSVSLAVSAVPEGLPAVVTITLAIGVQRLAKRNSIVRRLSAVEGLGSVTVICTDKTGTLTKNEMTVREIIVGRKVIKVTGSGYDPKGKFYINGREIDVNNYPVLRKLIEIGLYCNDAKLIYENGEWNIIGDPTEAALIVLAVKAGYDVEESRKKCPRISEIPFDSIRKRMSTVNLTEDGKRIVYMKGAPEIILNICKYIEDENGVRRITESDREEIIKNTSKLAEKALRTLAFAYKFISKENFDEKDIEKDLIFVGIVGMIDPPRPEVPEAIKKAREAGVKVIMVTGDHKSTAAAIAREIGLIDREDSLIITGKEIESMNDDEFLNIVDKVSVFARVSPEHKIKIVDALKKKGHIVAMTGDGVNDAPSVKRADIGIAMGIRGSDVTREAADIVLADDNFSTIVKAIEEGRAIYDNIRKFIRLLLSANWDEIFAVFVSAMLDLPIPFTAVQILWINLVTDGLPALALGLDPPAKNVMKRPPRDPKEQIYHGMKMFILISIIIALVSWITPFYIALINGRSLTEARTLAFTQAVIFELLLALNCRSEEKYVFSSFKEITRNRSLLLAIIISLILHILVVYHPFLQIFFKTT
ncbi:MAG TPA: cation-translocating P-type ATPase, partial [Thermoprotei archaeon]|nr:cation-translocating P-type ATPase [Thermoprotei archaeon]